MKYVNPEEEKSSEQTGTENQQGLARAQFVIPYFTIVLIAALFAVYIFQNLAGFDRSFQFAEANNQLIRNGQYWRLVTGSTMHGFALHLILNCLAFYNLGRAIEFLSNRAHLAIVFFFAVLGGSLMSVLFSPDINSVGASGGIMGLAGYLTIYGYKRRRLLPPGFLKNMLFNVGFVAAMGIIGYQYIDNGAHLGGFLVGAIYGYIQIPKDLHEDPRKADAVTIVLGYATLVSFVGFCLLSILLITRKITL